jgi:hypothetical protein
MLTCDILHIPFRFRNAKMMRGLKIIQRKESSMSKKDKQENEPVSPWQKVFDNVWLLFLVSLLISTLVYNVWGLIDLMNVPPAP